MLAGLFGILLCQLAGEVLSYKLALPVPGPVLGMAFMFLVLTVLGRIKGSEANKADEAISRSGTFILQNMSLLFVPAGVGVVQKLDLLATYGTGLVVAIVASTVVTLIATVTAFLIGARLSDRLFGEGEDL